MGARIARRSALAASNADHVMKHATPGCAKPFPAWEVPSPLRLSSRPSQVFRRRLPRQFHPERSRRRQPSRPWRRPRSPSRWKRRLI